MNKATSNMDRNLANVFIKFLLSLNTISFVPCVDIG
jgi:hypothetical protein